VAVSSRRTHAFSAVGSYFRRVSLRSKSAAVLHQQPSHGTSPSEAWAARWQSLRQRPVRQLLRRPSLMRPSRSHWRTMRRCVAACTDRTALPPTFFFARQYSFLPDPFVPSSPAQSTLRCCVPLMSLPTVHSTSHMTLPTSSADLHSPPLTSACLRCTRHSCAERTADDG
jgi:hypothetical protein